MRIDKFLKVSRVIKRRSVANEVCSAGRVTVNGRPAKAGTTVSEGDIVEIRFGNGITKFRIRSIRETVRKNEAGDMVEMLEEAGQST